ncbi:MAG: bifunctional phosphopantothenoylcysteine decarboxylase/phosphopantothenate--cysteine ligase CoaBC [Gemmatimonadota bacterium]
MNLQGLRVLLAVTGGIAAYKTPSILRLLSQAGADVRVVLTEAAGHFVAPDTMEVLSRHPVQVGLFERSDEFPVLHIGLAQWADVLLVAPITANTLGKMALGLADNLLTSVYMATEARVVIAPAMEEHMLASAPVQANLRRLAELGVHIVDAAEGVLASGASGKGRMAEPREILEQVLQVVGPGRAGVGDLAGLRLLVTAGPTIEDIDPVRYLGNRSTGKMGYALARRARRRGALVHLVAGPTSLPDPPGVAVHHVRSALEMQAAAEGLFDEVDAAILAAAVSDYRVASPAADKIRGGAAGLSLELVPNPDIAAGLGARKAGQVLVGFAVETGRGVDEARAKLHRKNLDLIALNSLQDEGAAFAVDTNVVTLIEASGEPRALPRMSKDEVADRLLDRTRDLWRAGRA